MLEAAGEDLLQTSVRILNQTTSIGDWSSVRSQITYVPGIVPWFQFRHNIDIAGSPTFLFN